MILVRFAISLFALALLGMALSLSAASNPPERHGALDTSSSRLMPG